MKLTCVSDSLDDLDIRVIARQCLLTEQAKDLAGQSLSTAEARGGGMRVCRNFKVSRATL